MMIVLAFVGGALIITALTVLVLRVIQSRWTTSAADQDHRVPGRQRRIGRIVGHHLVHDAPGLRLG
jgi:hypothetical protein